MRKKLLISLLCVSGFFGSLQSEAQHIPFRKYCATDSMTNAALKMYPDYARKRAEFQKHVLALNSKQNNLKVSGATNYTIPVVVHIMHTYGVDNISDAQVNDAIRIVNEDFSKSNTDTAAVVADYQSRYANVGFQFKLARIDPNGNCTNGITRTYTTLTNNADNNVKALIDWDPTKYLNIWVVTTISFGAGGYSYLPCGVPQNIEGVVVLSTQFGSIGRSNGGNFSARTLTHEIGHYMGLPHVWGGSNDPGDPANCGMDDGIADTPNTVGSTNFSCNLTANTCTAPDVNDVTPGVPFPDNVQNYMDYSSCARMFTNGQKAVMVNALSSEWCRSNLSSATNLVATGTNPGYSAICAPTPDFKVTINRVCAGSAVSFIDQSYNIAPNTSVNYLWTFPGGTPATSTLQNPIVTYNTPGIYNVSLTTSNGTNGNSITKNSVVTVRNAVGSIVAPYSYSFEDQTFPNDATDPLKSYEVIKPTSIGWERTVAAAVTGNAAVRVRNSNMPAGTLNSLITPPLDLTNLTSATLKYKVAYAQKDATSSDKLTILMSNDCGATWTIRNAKVGSALATTGSVLVPGTFTPTSSQWRQESFNINSSFIGPNTIIKFDALSQQGNTIYLDDIEVTGNIVGTKEEMAVANALTISPNPAHGDAALKVNLQTKDKVNVSVFSITGQQLGMKTLKASQNAEQQINLSEITGTASLKAGVYIIKLEANGFSTQKKAVIY